MTHNGVIVMGSCWPMCTSAIVSSTRSWSTKDTQRPRPIRRMTGTKSTSLVWTAMPGRRGAGSGPIARPKPIIARARLTRSRKWEGAEVFCSLAPRGVDLKGQIGRGHRRRGGRHLRQTCRLRVPLLAEAPPSPRRCAGGVKSRLPPAVLHEVPMRLIGLAVVLAVSLVLAPWAAEAQRAAKAYKSVT